MDGIIDGSILLPDINPVMSVNAWECTVGAAPMALGAIASLPPVACVEACAAGVNVVGLSVRSSHVVEDRDPESAGSQPVLPELRTLRTYAPAVLVSIHSLSAPTAPGSVAP